MDGEKLSDPFWLSNPNILFNNCDIIPTQKMSTSERLNALTRLLIITTIVLYFMEYEQTFTVFILGIFLIIILRNVQKEGFTPRRGRFDPCHTCKGDSRSAYINTKYETTPIDQHTHENEGINSYTHAHYKVIPQYVPAPYRKVWRNEPKFCSEFSQYPKSYNIIPQVGGSPEADNYMNENFNAPSPRGHFEDEEWVDNTPTSSQPQKHSVSPAVQSAFMRDSMQFRNNIMGEYIDQFERQRNHLCTNFKPGRKTF